MKISVLINNYNYSAYLNACIDSVLAQDHDNFEVVVVDDGSTDNSRELILAYGDRILPVLKPNAGQASSFNAGFFASSGDIICLLDADDTFLPGKLSALDRIFSQDGVKWCFDKVTNDEYSQPPSVPVVKFKDDRAALARGRFPVLPVPTSGLSFSRELLAQILPMREANDVVLSDNYLKFAAAYLGNGALVETPLSFQRIHASNRYTSSDRARVLKPKIMTATGLELAQRYPGLKRLGRSLVAGGLAGSPLGGSDLRNEVKAVTQGGAFRGEANALLAMVYAKRWVQKAKRIVAKA